MLGSIASPTAYPIALVPEKVMLQAPGVRPTGRQSKVYPGETDVTKPLSAPSMPWAYRQNAIDAGLLDWHLDLPPSANPAPSIVSKSVVGIVMIARNRAQIAIVHIIQRVEGIVNILLRRDIVNL